MYARDSGLRLQLGTIAVVLMACACLMGAFAARANADSGDWFCPTSGTGTISLGPNSGCTNSYYNALTQVAYYHASGANVDHCAVSKATSDPGGSSSNVIPAVCGYGVAPYGELNTAYYSGGRWAMREARTTRT